MSCLILIGGRKSLYYSQIRMQVAFTAPSWCGFVYEKCLVIDRIQYDNDHWCMLQDKLVKSYFDILLWKASHLQIKPIISLFDYSKESSSNLDDFCFITYSTIYHMIQTFFFHNVLFLVPVILVPVIPSSRHLLHMHFKFIRS